MRWNGTRFAKSLSACQWMSVVTCKRHERITREHPGEACIRQLAALEVENGREWARRAFPDVDPRPDLVARLGERVLVVEVEPEERGDMEPLRMLVTERRPLEQLGQPLAERVGELGHDARQAVRPVRSTSET